ncbi:thiamine-phosphate kinase [Leptospira licerasiae]|uniref:Thiamine-monophosphate kinase n=1 Tax=Leptospira licerasiae str. MMD4847 TaxID=1049971 RepID=A0ABN0H4R3_9LEPT|nr:thiamine-phosphate kinase [Leptospira licerasiae]EIE03192.1 thiamine-phosphate kinase [Leptospira licerasiae serovar Varillal str. VAR 010]EJZ40700.1 thiamine-phosphate kinase [Leptospira licerasiae str. MMD4847]
MNEEELISSLYPPGKEQENDCYSDKEGNLITTDTIAEGTHFRLDWSRPEDLANKLVEVNVSDIAAANGTPQKAFFNFGLSPSCNRKEFLEPFIDSFKKALNSYEIELCGGDTYRTQELNLTLTLLGKSSYPVDRKGGKPGDNVYLSGHIGASLLGYKILEGAHISLSPEVKKIALDRHLRPKSRLNLSRSLYSKNKIHAGMDLTDGLKQDVFKLAKSSGVKIELDLDKLPFENGVKEAIGIEGVLTSGEELELVFLSPEELPPFWEGISIRKIGTVFALEKGEFPQVKYSYEGKPYSPKESGFRHF